MISKQIQTFLDTENPKNTLWIAYSGGVDSHVLLHALSRYKNQYDIRGVHVHHGLLADADHWSQHCIQTCEALNIPCEIIKVKVDASNGESLEAAARYARYGAFEKLVKPSDYLLTAHHQDDQAETFLLQLLRGAGVKGLSAMPVKRIFTQGYLYRPLLSVMRKDILIYADAYQLSWIEDPSNEDHGFARNFIRHQLMPLLTDRWPQASKTIARSCKHIAEASFLLDKQGLEDLAKLEGEKASVLAIGQLLNLSIPRQRNVLRYWISQHHQPLPDERKLQAIIDEVVLAREDANPCVAWGGVEVRRFHDDLYLLPSLEWHDVRVTLNWGLQEPLSLPTKIGVLHATEKRGLVLKVSAEDDVEIRFRRGGEVCDLPKRGRHTLKKLLQEWSVPSWERDRIPLVFVNGQLAMVVGYAICVGFFTLEGELGYDVKLLD